MTLTATFEPADSRVLVEVTSAPVVPGLLLYVERQVSGQPWVPVRSAYGVEPSSAGNLSIYDYEFTPNVVNTYRARTAIVYDDFDRTETDEWGNALSGQTYTQEGGDAEDYAVAAGVGTMDPPNDAILLQYISVAADTDSRVDVSLSEAPADAPVEFGISARGEAGTSPGYSASIQVQEDGDTFLVLIDGDNELMDFVTLVDWEVSTTYTIRLQVSDDLIQAKVWEAGEEEPGNWDLALRDTALTVGTWVGPTSQGLVAMSNTPTVSFDNYIVEDISTDTEPTFTTVGTDTVTPTQTGAWVKFPLFPAFNQEVDLCDWSDVVRPARGAVFPVLGRRDPVAVTEVRGSRRFDVTIYAEDSDANDELMDALASGEVILLQTPGPSETCNLNRRRFPEQGYFFVGDVTSSRPVRGSATHVVTLPLTEVAAPAYTIGGSAVTWECVEDNFATWADVQSFFPTWFDVLAYTGCAS